MFKIDEIIVNKEYELAKGIYSTFGVDTDKVLKIMDDIHISLNCWQGDDITGFEKNNGLTGSDGILATGNYPGKARSGEELRLDMEKALSLIPGKHRVNLHAIYAETNGVSVERDRLEVEHFKNWIEWAKKNGIGLDFNPTFFAHKKSSSGFTLSSKDKEIRDFWIRHGKSCRKIASEIGRELNNPSINNFWIPDGSKDLISDRFTHRKILKDSLDEIFSEEKEYTIDAVESKLFGIGSESYVVGSHEFYMGYSLKNDIMLCLDMGHFHPTENIADKISSILTYRKSLLLHVSRGIRWDSDHVVILNDDLQAVASEVKRCNALGNVFFALDFFDASINRLSAWIIGARATLKSLIISLLEPTLLLIDAENNGNFGDRLALMEEFKSLPFGSVWNKYCQNKNVPVGAEWLSSVKDYEEKVLLKRK
jgi:L-rhamnose isomerase